MPRRLSDFIRTRVMAGLLVLLPVAGCLYLLASVMRVAMKVVGPLNARLPFQRLVGVAIADILAVVLVLLVCFCLGVLVTTGIGRAIGQGIENRVLNTLPGYRLLKRVSRQIAGNPDESLGKPVLLTMGDSRQIGFLVDEHADGHMTVFVPSVPTIGLGALFLVRPEQVEKLNASIREVIDYVTKFGASGAPWVGRPAPTRSVATSRSEPDRQA